MSECPVCNNKKYIYIDIIMLRKRFVCENCGSKLRVKPKSVILVSIVSFPFIALLGLTLGFSEDKLSILILLIFSIVLYLFLYGRVARLEKCE